MTHSPPKDQSFSSSVEPIQAAAVIIAGAGVVSFLLNSTLLKGTIYALDSLHLVLIQLVLVALFHEALGLPSASAFLGLKKAATTTVTIVKEVKVPTPLPSSTIHPDAAPAAEQPQKVETAKDVVPAPAENPNLKRAGAIMDKFISLANDKDPSRWQQVAQQNRGEFNVTVFKNTERPFCLRLEATLESTPEEAFDLLSDPDARPTWDDVTNECGILEHVQPACRVMYMRTKAIFPTAARDVLVFGSARRMVEAGPRTYIYAISGYGDSHPKYTARKGDVRMELHVGGQIVSPDPAGRKGFCRVVQIMDGDLKGWLPASVVSLVTTQAMPAAMGKVNSILRKKAEKSTESSLIKFVEDELKKAGTPAAAPAATPTPPAVITTPAAPAAQPVAVKVAPTPLDTILDAVLGPLSIDAKLVRATILLLHRSLSAVQPWFVTFFVLIYAIRANRRKAVAAA
ncbi:hypothetical protein BJ742DRAFT_333388 [Cladochytrium replicatum]|nr:hypothetical protein BJ742DRAFT_333388 [Cladochytrium replicatum]